MKTTKTLLVAIALSAGLFSATGANAALTSALGGQGVYDTDLNITWLADPNLAASNTFGIGRAASDTPGIYGIRQDGTMSWNTAQDWIAAMNTANYLGFNDWRLPTSDTCFGYNCTGSEMGHLFYNELGGVGGQSLLSGSDPDLALFQNINGFNGYHWSGTEYAPNTTEAWLFHPVVGWQDSISKNNLMFAWAVRPGQVAVAAVPEPETYAMLLAGLGLLGFTARRRNGVSRQTA